MAPSHQKYFTSDGHQMDIGWPSDGHRMAIRQNGFLYTTIQHSHTSDAERMEIEFRQDQKCHVNSKTYITQHNKNK